MTNEVRRPDAENTEARSVSSFGSCSEGYSRRWSYFVSHFALIVAIFATFAPKPVERPKPLDPVQGEREARALVGEMLSQKPGQNVTNTGVLMLRDGDGNKRELRVRFELRVDGNNTLSTYEAHSPDGSGQRTRLTVIRSDGQPNQYQLEESGAAAGNTSPKTLSGNDAMIPFAGSDFWLADLGLEFLHWPQQRILYKDTRHSQYCGVLESINPDPASGGYARVLSWIDLDAPHGVVHADGFDSNRKRIKQFDPKSVKKIEGQYKLEAMEMLDEKTGSRTVIKFDLRPN